MKPAIARVEPLHALLLLLLGGFAALFLILTRDYNPTAALFPRWVALASLILLAFAVGAQLRAQPKAPAENLDDEFPQPGPGAAYWPAVLALQAGYIVSIYLVGFTLATLLYLVVAPLQMRYFRWFVIGAQALFLTAIISGSFIWFFHIRLPKGVVWSLW